MLQQSDNGPNGDDQTQEEQTAEQMLQNHKRQKAFLQDLENKMDFSYDLENTLTKEERQADLILTKYRDEIANNEKYNLTIHNFFENKQTMEDSKLFKALDLMPKGGIHHIHTTAANSAESYLELTYDERVYYSERFRLFKVYPKHQDVEDGYLQCVQLRNFYSKPEEFDTLIKNQILLRQEQTDNQDSHGIWKHFQHKFTKVGELSKFVPFFSQLLKNALQSCIRQNVMIVEFRHISGLLFDEDKNHIPFLEELKIIRQTVDELKKETPYFEFRLILTGLKLVGKSHIEQILMHVHQGASQEDKRLVELIAGFDMVNEEDFTPEIGQFAESIQKAQQAISIVQSCDQGISCFFHAGETHQRGIKNLHDSILLGSKRIGHGFQLQIFPHLQDLCKQKDICIECCPLSNMVLGYTKDLRQHPVSYLIRRGLQASISSDDPGLFGYQGVTLDYAYATGAWSLNLRDLKKFSLNGIKYASISDNLKKEILDKYFYPKWNEWIAIINQDKL